MTEAAKKCGNCGFLARAEASFCPSCGTPLMLQPHAEPAPIPTSSTISSDLESTPPFPSESGTVVSTKKTAKILVVFYSMTGNVAKLARMIARGSEEAGAEVRIRQVQELVPKEKWNEVMRQVKLDLIDIPHAAMDDLVWADGIAFGTPTRYGNWSAQMKQFIDQTGELWQAGKLIDKVACIFTSTASLHGGQETTMLTSLPPLLHHGMIIIGVPYSEQGLFRKDYGGGSPYSASSVGEPDETDLEIAKTFGRRLADIAGKVSSKY